MGREGSLGVTWITYIIDSGDVISIFNCKNGLGSTDANENLLGRRELGSVM